VELQDTVAVVTGGASGIGRALALRLADAAVRGVVVADVDAAGAESVAAEIGRIHPGAAIAVACDVTREADLAAALEAAERRFGPVDLFCANAGVAIGTDLSTPLETWDLAFAVNVRAHVTAARLLLPGWLARGRGYFLATASAAGLLSQIGSAPYAVTKHAAVGFAEWLSITYGDRGVRVSCLCPMGVNTNMLRAGRELPAAEALGMRVVEAAGAVLEPEAVAEIVVEALGEERFLILPHPEVLEFLRRKTDDYDRWLRGMRRLQTQVDGAS
jgi:NAD(P)-dependent dehydrogenase (short-subunit alcohol dehydrogenase family)